MPSLALEPGGAAQSPLSPTVFRTVLGHLPTGVTVLTAFGADGPAGMTANSVTSLSLDPPLILACPARSSSTWPALRQAGRFCVNVMAAHDAAACKQFSAKTADRFHGISWHPRPAGPAIDGAVAWIDAELEEEHQGGDHTIAVARVTAVEARAGTDPLLFFRGQYWSLAARPNP